MRILGRRHDGAVQVGIGGGLAVLLKGDRCTPPLDVLVANSMGPWTPADNSDTVKIEVTRRMNHARVAQMDYFINLGMSFDEQSKRVTAALRSKLGYSDSYSPFPVNMGDLYIPPNGLGDDWVVYCANGGKHYGLVYSIDEAGTVTFEGNPVEVRSTWESLTEEEAERGRAEADTTTFDEAVELRDSAWFKRFMASKKKSLGQPTMRTTPGGSTKDLSVKWQSLWDSVKDRIDLKGKPPAEGASKDEHPFSYCIQTVVPAMENPPDDPEAFCAWWKNEGPGSK